MDAPKIAAKVILYGILGEDNRATHDSLAYAAIALALLTIVGVKIQQNNVLIEHVSRTQDESIKAGYSAEIIFADEYHAYTDALGGKLRSVFTTYSNVVVRSESRK